MKKVSMKREKYLFFLQKFLEKSPYDDEVSHMNYDDEVSFCGRSFSLRYFDFAQLSILSICTIKYSHDCIIPNYIKFSILLLLSSLPHNEKTPQSNRDYINVFFCL